MTWEELVAWAADQDFVPTPGHESEVHRVRSFIRQRFRRTSPGVVRFEINEGAGRRRGWAEKRTIQLKKTAVVNGKLEEVKDEAQPSLFSQQ